MRVGEKLQDERGEIVTVIRLSPTDPGTIRVRDGWGRERWDLVEGYTSLDDDVVPAPAAAAAPPAARTLDEIIDAAIVARLIECGGNIRAAARSLGVPKSTLADRVRKRGLLGDAVPRPRRTSCAVRHLRALP